MTNVVGINNKKDDQAKKEESDRLARIAQIQKDKELNIEAAIALAEEQNAYMKELRKQFDPNQAFTLVMNAYQVQPEQVFIGIPEDV